MVEKKMKTIVVQGKEYKLPNIDFNAICELEDLGLDFSKVQNKSFSTIRILLAYVMQTDVDTAGKIYGEMDSMESLNLGVVLLNMLNDSDFFQRMAKQEQANA